MSKIVIDSVTAQQQKGDHIFIEYTEFEGNEYSENIMKLDLREAIKLLDKLSTAVRVCIDFKSI